LAWTAYQSEHHFENPVLACHLKGIKDGVHYEYRETMPYKREPEFMEVSPKDHGMKNNTMLEPDLIGTILFFLETFFEQLYGP